MLQNTIGEGAFGAVKRAIFDTPSRVVVVKIYKDIGQQADLDALQEAIMCEKFRECEFIVKILDIMVVTEDPRRQFGLVFEEFGQDTWQLLKTQGAFDAMNLREAACSMLLAFEAMHGKGVVHTDVKPTNVLCKGGAYKLADLGCATMAVKEHRNKTINVQTLQYRAPEVLFGRSDWSYPIDMWSFALTLINLCRMLFNMDKPADSAKMTKQQYWMVLSEQLGPPPANVAKSWPHFPREQTIGSPRGWPLEVTSRLNQGMDLILDCLLYNSARRPSAQEALRHEYFLE